SRTFQVCSGRHFGSPWEGCNTFIIQRPIAAPTGPRRPNAGNPMTSFSSSSPVGRWRAWQRVLVPLAGLLVALLAAGCSSSDRSRSGFLEPYKFAIPQGNYLNQQMLDQVREGMSREQVRLAIGSPLLTDIFHPQRWDYVFRFQYPNGDAE